MKKGPQAKPDEKEEGKGEEGKVQSAEEGKGRQGRKKRFKNKYVKGWKEKYERFYKNKKKFVLDVIREEDGPFLFKIMMECKGVRESDSGKVQGKLKGSKGGQPEGVSPEKLRAKVLNFFKSTQIKPETEENESKKRKKRKTVKLALNYDKLKLSTPKENRIRAFVTVLSREDGVKIYDYFYSVSGLFLWW